MAARKRRVSKKKSGEQCYSVKIHDPRSMKTSTVQGGCKTKAEANAIAKEVRKSAKGKSVFVVAS